MADELLQRGYRVCVLDMLLDQLYHEHTAPQRARQLERYVATLSGAKAAVTAPER